MSAAVRCDRKDCTSTRDAVIAMLDDLTGSGLCEELVGWCEEQGA